MKNLRIVPISPEHAAITPHLRQQDLDEIFAATQLPHALRTKTTSDTNVNISFGDLEAFCRVLTISKTKALSKGALLTE